MPTARRTLSRTAAAITLAALGAGLALASAAPAAAQDPRVVTPSGSPCSYDSCVLRVEDTWFSRKLVRGPEGTVVARLGIGGPSLASVVQLSDSAVHHARLYQRAQTTGTVITTLGTLASLASWVIYANADRDDDLRQEVTAINVGALVAGIVGTTFHLKARRELSRSLWWYNRAVVGQR